MFLVFLLVVALAWLFDTLTPRSYAATSRLLLKPVVEAALDPVAGSVNPDSIRIALETEAELARSPVIVDRVIAEVGFARLYPQLAAAQQPSPEDQPGEAFASGRARFSGDLAAETSPRSAILTLTFQARDPRLAEETLDAFIRHYLPYRGEILDGPAAADLERQRTALEQRLTEVEREIERLLERSGVSLSASELATLDQRMASLTEQLAAAEAERSELQGRAAGLRRDLAKTDREIEVLREPAADDGGPALRRIGPNPVRQDLEGDFANARVSAEGVDGRIAALTRQKALLSQAYASVDKLEPRYSALLRERDTLRETARAVRQKEETRRLDSEAAIDERAALVVYEPVRPAASGLFAPSGFLAGGALLGVLAALAAGLARALTARTFATPGAVQQALDLPVLAAVPERDR
jgi:uncharacterized protein involved in exopolysaccharide biosynthesis